MRARRLEEAVKVDRRLDLLPTLDEVIYVHPMAGKFVGKGRKCANCVMWYSEQRRCHLMGADLPVDADEVCNYHIGGSPIAGPLRGTGDMELLDPRMAGLSEAPPKGTSCGNCHHVVKGKPNRCNVVTQRGGDGKLEKAIIELGGCCNRWQLA